MKAGEGKNGLVIQNPPDVLRRDGRNEIIYEESLLPYSQKIGTRNRFRLRFRGRFRFEQLREEQCGVREMSVFAISAVNVPQHHLKITNVAENRLRGIFVVPASSHNAPSARASSVGRLVIHCTYQQCD